MVSLKDVSEYLDEKMDKDENYIRCTFYELRVKKNLTEHETNQFLDYCKIRLRNNNYKIYVTGQRYVYNDANMTVQDNELLVAIKDEN